MESNHATVPSPTPPLRLGTRGSPLARWQANWVAEQLQLRGHAVELVEITTSGDQQQTGPLSDIGGEGLFTKQLQRALLAGDIDLAVHSLKDLPTTPVAGLRIGAVPQRASTADVLVARSAESFNALPAGARIGTGSLRRAAQLLHARPDLVIDGIRGNVDTRLGKLDAGEFDAIVLAAAGLERLGLDDRITEVFSTDVMLPAVGQGALAIECRGDDARTATAAEKLNHPASHGAVLVERQLLARLEAGCSAPVGALARVGDDDQMHLTAVVLSGDGRQRLTHDDAADGPGVAMLGVRVAEALLAQGAAELVAAAKHDS